MKNNLKRKITILAVLVVAGLVGVILFQSCRQKNQEKRLNEVFIPDCQLCG